MKANVIMTLTAAMALTAGAETYTLKGERYLRKYTAPQETPVYNAEIDAATVVRDFCDVPWTRSDVAESAATYHDAEALDLNVAARDRFDAALFCAGHTNGMHRAYANAAVYRFKLPDGQLPKLTGLSVNVYSDPYNANGARIVLLTNDSGAIPSDCATVRGDVEGGIRQTGVVRRVTRVSGGKDYWFPATSNVVFSADSLGDQGVSLGRYLYVFVLLENYSTTRSNWLEGCSYIENAVRITTSGPVPGWTDGSSVDLRDMDESNPSEVNIRIVANADIKGKLRLQAVSCRTRRILRKWSFDCDYHFGKNEMIVTVPNKCEDDELLAHYGGIYFEAWVGGNDKYDVSNWYGCSNGREDRSIELTRSNPIFARINIYDNKSDRNVLWGQDDGSAEDQRGGTGGQALSGGEMNHVRIVPHLMSSTRIDGSRTEREYVECLRWLPTRVVAEFDVDASTHPCITEADFIRDGKFDIYWDGFATTDFALNNRVAADVGDITAVKYQIVMGVDGPEGLANVADTTTVVRAYSTLIERRFEPQDARTTPTELKIAQGAILYGGRPAFTWRLDEPTTVENFATSSALFGCSYTAFQIQVTNMNTNVAYDSGVQRAPAKDATGRFVWTAPLVTGLQTDLANIFNQTGDWKWRVAMYNAKFKPKTRANGWSDYATFSVDDNGNVTNVSETEE